MTPAQYRALDAILTLTGRPIRHAVLIRDSVITDDDGIRPEKIPFSAVAAVNSPSWSEPRAIRNLPQSSSPAALTPRCRTCRDSWKRPIGRIAEANHPDHGVHLATHSDDMDTIRDALVGSTQKPGMGPISSLVQYS